MNAPFRSDAAVSLQSEPARIYYLHPLLVQGADGWRDMFSHAAALGFSSVLTVLPYARQAGDSVFRPESLTRLDPSSGLGTDATAAAADLAELARTAGVDLMLDLVAPSPVPQAGAVADPRRSPLTPAYRPAGEADAALSEWMEQVAALAGAGVAGFRCLDLPVLGPEQWQSLIDHVRRLRPAARFYAYTPGTAFELRQALAGRGFDGCFSSLAWWDLEERWLIEEHRLQTRLGPQIAFPEAPFGKRIAHGTESGEVLERRARRALQLATFLGDGLMVPAGFEFGSSLPLDPVSGPLAAGGEGLRVLRDQQNFDLTDAIRAANRALQGRQAPRPGSSAPVGLISAGAAQGAALIRSHDTDLRRSKGVEIALFNRDLRRAVAIPDQALQAAAGAFLPLEGEATETRARLLKAGEVRLLKGSASRPIVSPPAGDDMEEATSAPRLAIEAVTPIVDAGRFPVKKIVGDTVRVEADIVCDGHDPLAAALLYRPLDEERWQEVPMQLAENDRWRAEFPLQRIGRHVFAVEAWRNPFAIFRYEFEKKHEARLDLNLEIQEGLKLIAETLENAVPTVKPQVKALLQALQTGDTETRTQLLLDSETFALMAAADRRPFRVRTESFAVDAERPGAGFASWYELFPRSQSGDPERHGTFDDVIRRLPAVREMGFDVVYFPPIHPIGATNRKGRNNALKAAPGDPGSPYAIGSEAGGHEAIHPELGTFEDFRRLIAAAGEEGLEVALDLAIQCSPDHPWLKEHPGWFDWRPDGTIRYAENPPKKYEDIVNVDFYARDAVPALWTRLLEIVELWVGEGVKLFRVDNPHTKPFPFWEWLIGAVRARHPDVVFLSEAFTRPKVMYRLAKIGFSQSYTYFTWRNAKWELEQYMREITTEAPKDFFRPHFFVNTHDINPDFLQNAPRSAYLIRAALAATLSGLWGIYNGFELCEGRPDAKRKEYADSEKYEIRAWDWDRPGHIKGEIALLNRIRSDNPALHSHLGLTLLPAWNDQVLFFEKASPGRNNVVLVAISLDPNQPQEADVELPLWRFGRPDDGSLAVEDLITGQAFSWTGKHQRLRLEPGMPFSLWRVR